MIVKRLILKKILNSGFVAEFLLVKCEGEYQAVLCLNGKQVKGPPLPVALTTPKDDLTHWMGNRPTVGLTTAEAEKIIEEVECENGVLKHQQRSGWK